LGGALLSNSILISVAFEGISNEARGCCEGPSVAARREGEWDRGGGGAIGRRGRRLIIYIVHMDVVDIKEVCRRRRER